MCRHEYFCFKLIGIVGFGGSKFVFLVIFSKLIVQCVIANYIQGSSTLLVHFVLFHTRWILILDICFKTFITCLVFVLSFKAWMQA